MQIALVTTAGADTYRLHDASFAITNVVGRTSATLNSEVDASASVLMATLTTGPYSIALASGWDLQHLVAGTFVPVAAELLSSNPLSFQVTAGGIADIVYRFRTNGREITFGSGRAEVRVSVTVAPDASIASGGSPSVDTGGAGGALGSAGAGGVTGVGGATAVACDPVLQSGCPSGQACTVLSESPATTACYVPRASAAGVNTACTTSGDCAPGLACIADLGPTQSSCKQLCRGTIDCVACVFGQGAIVPVSGGPVPISEPWGFCG